MLLHPPNAEDGGLLHLVTHEDLGEALLLNRLGEGRVARELRVFDVNILEGFLSPQASGEVEVQIAYYLLQR